MGFNLTRMAANDALYGRNNPIPSMKMLDMAVHDPRSVAAQLRGLGDGRNNGLFGMQMKALRTELKEQAHSLMMMAALFMVALDRLGWM